MQYFNAYANGIVCNLCEHFCFLEPNAIGLCQNQQNQNNQLITLSFSRPCALNITHIEERPFYHIKPTSTVFYPYAKAIGLIAKDKGLLNLFHTVGYGSQALNEDLLSWVDALHVDLKSMNPAYYKSVLGVSFSSIKASLEFYAKSDIHLEITTLLIDGINSSDEELVSMANFVAELSNESIWHLSAFTPAHHLAHLQPTQTSTLLKAFEIAKEAGIEHVYFGNVPWLNETKCLTCKETLLLRKEYTTLENHLIQGRCPHCHTKLKGIW